MPAGKGAASGQRDLERGRLEAEIISQGQVPAGIDEVGRGCLAGPVYAAVVILDYERLAAQSGEVRKLLRDSKKLSHAQRQKMLPVIHALSRDHGIASASVAEIEEHGIAAATFLAMRRALAQLTTSIDVLLVDGNRPIPDVAITQQTVVGGDNSCFAIAAASILAKEERDAHMRVQGEVFPAYGFSEHVGYGTRQHLDMIGMHGICHLHRRNFEPIRSLVQKSRERKSQVPSAVSRGG